MFLWTNVSWRKEKKISNYCEPEDIYLQGHISSYVSLYSCGKVHTVSQAFLDFTKLRIWDEDKQTNTLLFSPENISSVLLILSCEKAQGFCRDIKNIFSPQCFENIPEDKLHIVFCDNVGIRDTISAEQEN